MLTNAGNIDRDLPLEFGGAGDTCRKATELTAMNTPTAVVKNDNDSSAAQQHHLHQNQQQLLLRQQQQQQQPVHQRQRSCHHVCAGGSSDSGESAEPPSTYQLTAKLSPVAAPFSPVIIMSDEFAGSTGSCNVLVDTASGYQLQQPLLPRLLVPEATPRSSTSSQSCLSVPGAGSGSSHHGGGGTMLGPDGSR